MSAEVMVGATATAAGIGVAGLALAFDQNLAMASAGGLAMFLAVSATIPLQTRFFFGIGSFILGYIIGLMMIPSENLGSYAPFLAFLSSALGSTMFGSLHGWVSGGPTPQWVEWLVKMSPIKFKKGDSE